MGYPLFSYCRWILQGSAVTFRGFHILNSCFFFFRGNHGVVELRFSRSLDREFWFNPSALLCCIPLCILISKDMENNIAKFDKNCIFFFPI